MIIPTKNNLTDLAQQTALNAATSAGGTSFPIYNFNAFAASWAIQIGKTGEEQSEVLVLGTAVPNGTLNTTSASRYDHPGDTPVYPIKYDQVVFERSTTGTAGTATPMTGGTVTIQADHDVTIFDDTSGSSTYAYKTYFRSSVLNVTTTESDWITSAGFSFYSLAKLRERIKGKLYDAGFIQSDSTIDDWINEWLENMNNAAVHVNQDYSLGTADVAFGTAGYGTITASNYKDIRRLWFTTDGNNFYVAQRISQTDFEPTQVFSASQPTYYPFGDSVFGVKPDGQAGTARISYYTLPVVLNDDTDELPVVMRGYSKSFVDYGLSQALHLDGKADQAKEKMRQAEQALSLFVSDITPRSNSGPRFIKITDDISGENEDN